MYEFLQYRVRDAMTREPVTIGRRTTLAEVEALFERHDFNCLPVVEAGALVGIVTKLDLLKAFAFTKRRLLPPYEKIMRRPAAVVMNARPTTMRPEMPLTRVLQRLIDTRHKSFPVVADGRLVGMVAREDVLRILRRAAAGERAPSAAGAGDAPADPSRAVSPRASSRRSAAAPGTTTPSRSRRSS
jgi:CBS domain-containing protein